MFHPLRRWLIVSLSALILFALFCQHANAVIILFKDGFILRGSVSQKFERFRDPASGRVFKIPVSGSLYALETPSRKIYFSPHQLADIIDEKTNPLPKWMNLSLIGRPGTTDLPGSWSIDKVTPWNNRWERELDLTTSRGKLNMTQRLTYLNPDVAQITTLRYFWVQYFRTQELGLDTVKKLLKIHFDKADEGTPTEERIKMAKFLAQAGWPEAAKLDLDQLLKDAPDEKTKIEQEIETLNQLLAANFVEGLDLDDKVGRYANAWDRIQFYFKENLAKYVKEDRDLHVFEMKTKYEKLKRRLEDAQRLLKEVPFRIAKEEYDFFSKATTLMTQELTGDTVERLQTFLDQAKVYELALKQKRKPEQTAEEILSYAITGWLLGNNSSEGNLKTAKQLWKAREFVLQYQQTASLEERARLRDQFQKENKLKIDLLAKLIQALPPPDAHTKLDSKLQQFKVQLPGQEQGPTYFVQLPPEYNHSRAHPVLVVLHDAPQQVQDAARIWSYLAAKHGYILVAPVWTQGFQNKYEFTERENGLVLDVLRDLRRRFQVDSDRVYLFGAGEGGYMAYDVGLSHPDQFAGVLPMNAYPRFFSEMSMANAQYLPFYVVDGQANGESPINNHKLFKDWIPRHYPVIFIEYRGRGGEWFVAEFPEMMNWMDRKKRAFPARQLGEGQSGSRKSQEFTTGRDGEQRFYWLSTNSVDPRYINQATRWDKFRQPAHMHANVYSSNEIRVEVGGLKQISIWLAPGMVDFSKKVKVSINRRVDLGPMMVEPSLEVLMEDFFRQGDRQRLFLARIDYPPRGK